MKTQMTKLSLIALTLTMVIAASANAVVLLDQSDYDEFGPLFLNAVAGGPPWGGTSYCVNDVTVDGTGWVITDISTYYNGTGFFESVSQGYLNIAPKTGALPVDDPTTDVMVPLTLTIVAPNTYKVTASGLNIELAPGEYWIGITPIAGSLYDGLHLSSATLIGDATPSFDPYGTATWTNSNPDVDASILILGLDDVVATESITLDSVKSLYR